VGNWTHHTSQTYFDDTFTVTSTPGASFSFNFSGTQLFIVAGRAAAVQSNDYSANYVIDGVPSTSPQLPYVSDNGFLVNLEFLNLPDTTHTISVTVATAGDTNPYTLDYIAITPSSGGFSSRVVTVTMAPSSTSTTPVVTTRSTPIGAIVGGVVVGIAILVIAVHFFLSRRTRGRQDDHSEKPGVADVLSSEYYVEPFNPIPSGPAPHAGSSRPEPQLAFSNADGRSNQPWNPSVGQTAINSHPPRHTQSGSNQANITYVSDDTPRSRTQKVALMAQQYENVEQPVQYQGSHLSETPTEAPPTYRPS